MKKLLVFLVVILTGILFVHCEKDVTEKIPASMEEELALLPDSPQNAGYVNFKSIRSSAIYSKLSDSRKEKPFEADEDYQEFKQMTGLDFQKDIDEFFMAMAINEEHDEPDLIATVKGNFNPQKIKNFINKKDTEKKVTELSFEGFTLYKPSNENMALCIVDENRIVFGRESKVKSWLENFKEGGTKSKLNPELKKQLANLKYKSDMWFTMNTKHFTEEIVEKMSKQPRLINFEGFKSLQRTNFSMKLDENVKFEGSGVFTDKERAALFRDAVKGFIATAKLSVSSDREVVDILNKINVELNRQEVSVNFKMSKDEVDKLLTKRKELAFKSPEF